MTGVTAWLRWMLNGLREGIALKSATSANTPGQACCLTASPLLQKRRENDATKEQPGNERQYRPKDFFQSAISTVRRQKL